MWSPLLSIETALGAGYGPKEYGLGCPVGDVQLVALIHHSIVKSTPATRVDEVVGVMVGVGVGVLVAVIEGVIVGVTVGVLVTVTDGVGVIVRVGVMVGVGVRVGVTVTVGVGVTEGCGGLGAQLIR